MKSDHGTDGILKREGHLMCDASTKESRLMDDYRRDGALEALRSKFGEITVRLQDAIIPRRGRFNKNAKKSGCCIVRWLPPHFREAVNANHTDLASYPDRHNPPHPHFRQQDKRRLDADGHVHRSRILLAIVSASIVYK